MKLQKLPCSPYPSSPPWLASDQDEPEENGDEDEEGMASLGGQETYEEGSVFILCVGHETPAID